MKRRLLNLLTVISLLLCVTAAGLSAWSYHRVEVLKWRGDKVAASAFAFRGGLHAGWVRWVNPGGRRHHFQYRHLSPAEFSPGFDPVTQCPWHRRLAGFGVGTDRTPSGDWRVQLRVPLASVACAGAVAPLLAWRRRVRHARRASRGQCVRCGYDLRGSGELCPECGTGTPGRSGKSSCAYGRVAHGHYEWGGGRSAAALTDPQGPCATPRRSAGSSATEARLRIPPA